MTISSKVMDRSIFYGSFGPKTPKNESEISKISLENGCFLSKKVRIFSIKSLLVYYQLCMMEKPYGTFKAFKETPEALKKMHMSHS